MSVYVNLNYKYHKIDSRKVLVKTSLFEYLETEAGESICDKQTIENIIKEMRGSSKYKEYLKRQAEYFSNQKGFSVEDLTFEELER